MQLVGLMPVRNEAWILGLSARVALLWVDELVMSLHCCVDRSAEIAIQIAKEFNSRVTVVCDDNPQWDEMRQRQGLLEIARCLDGPFATHIAICDADEILTGNIHGAAVREHVANLPPGHMLALPGYNLRGGIHQYHSSGIWGKRWFSVAFADHPNLHWAGDKFHSREPAGCAWKHYQPVAQGQGGIMHLWGASERRLKAKSAWYKVTERLRWPQKSVSEIDSMYSWAIKGRAGVPRDTPDTWQYASVPESWWAPYAQWMKYLDVDAEPWQELETRRLIEKHGREVAVGLDLFGVV